MTQFNINIIMFPEVTILYGWIKVIRTSHYSLAIFLIFCRRKKQTRNNTIHTQCWANGNNQYFASDITKHSYRIKCCFAVRRHIYTVRVVETYEPFKHTAEEKHSCGNRSGHGAWKFNTAHNDNRNIFG